MSAIVPPTNISEDQFWDTYKPKLNHLLPGGAPFSDCMFETFGEELEFVRSQPTEHIWTIIEGDDDNLFVSAGFHLVNRIGYLITEKPWVTGEEEVALDD